MKSWGLAEIWNASLVASQADRELLPRAHMWASELGLSFYDRYYRMKARTATTPPNVRSMRKFQAGNITEFLIKQILARAGLLRETQTRVNNSEFALDVHGKLDFLAGSEVRSLSPDDLSDLPESFHGLATSVIERMRELHPKGLREQILEIKSCSGMMFNLYEIRPAAHHMLQAFHYSHTLKIPASVIYISRDDLRVQEYQILPTNPTLLRQYQEDIEGLAAVLATDNPIPEPRLLLEDSKFRKNWKLQYSNYLPDYGFTQPDEYSDTASKLCGSLNRVTKRQKEGKPMTEKNMEALDRGIMFCWGQKV